MASSNSPGGDQPQFGLILHPAKQKKQALVQRTTVFDDDELDDSEPDDEQIKLKLPERNISQPLYPGRSATQVKSTLEAALEVDPNIFAYDEVYDDIHGEKGTSSSKKATNPKYMDSLLKSAELRKREKDKREERKIQKEREAEGDEFADKEVFITPAYKEKLEELKKIEERERKEAAFEAALDVTKQQDLSGFYRHLLKQTVGEEKILLHSISSRFENLHEPPPVDAASSKFNKVKNSKNRRIRQRNESASSEEEETMDPRKERDRAANKRVDSKRKEKDSSARETRPEEQQSTRTSEKSKGQEDARESNESRKDGSHGPNDCTVEKKKAEEEDKEAELPKVNKVDRRALIIELFTKRTVGQVFEEARQRYLERKAGTSSSS